MQKTYQLTAQQMMEYGTHVSHDQFAKYQRTPVETIDAYGTILQCGPEHTWEYCSSFSKPSNWRGIDGDRDWAFSYESNSQKDCIFKLPEAPKQFISPDQPLSTDSILLMNNKIAEFAAKISSTQPTDVIVTEIQILRDDYGDRPVVSYATGCAKEWSLQWQSC